MVTQKLEFFKKKIKNGTYIDIISDTNGSNVEICRNQKANKLKKCSLYQLSSFQKGKKNVFHKEIFYKRISISKETVPTQC